MRVAPDVRECHRSLGVRGRRRMHTLMTALWPCRVVMVLGFSACSSTGVCSGAREVRSGWGGDDDGRRELSDTRALRPLRMTAWFSTD
jgi:hypothetical protein